LPASGGILWDVAAIIGYLATAFTLVLYLYPLRRPGLSPPRLLSIAQHRRFGLVALGLAGLHTATLIVTQPQTTRYLLRSAPFYMLSGVAALAALAVLVISGLSARTGMRRAAQGFRASGSRPSPRVAAATHAASAAVLLGLLGAHIAGSGQMADRTSKVAVICGVLAMAVVWSAILPRWARLRTQWFTTVLPGAIATLVMLALPLPIVMSHLLEPAARPDVLPAQFPHDKHTTVNCLTCHHNLIDNTGTGSCIDCHRNSRAALNHSSNEATFHVFCRSCHVQLAQEGRKHGPTRACASCHRRVPTPSLSNIGSADRE
jgi:hypothetical protein